MGQLSIDWPSVRHIYLSPHLDDVVLSCGGTIARQVRRREAVAVLTIFAGSPVPGQMLSPFAQALHARWQASLPSTGDFSDLPAVRRVEDIRAFAAISPTIEVVHLPLPECIYRTDAASGQPLYASEEAIFGEVHPADPAIQALRVMPALPGGSTLYVPLGVGHHVDHQLVRRAAEGWCVSAQQMCFYEDYPYAADEAAVVAALGEHTAWEPLLMELSEDELVAKVRAVSAHASQLSTFWEDVESMANALRHHAALTGGERMWVRRAKVSA